MSFREMQLSVEHYLKENCHNCPFLVTNPLFATGKVQPTNSSQ